jgi:mannose-6-phosphate isomerase
MIERAATRLVPKPWGQTDLRPWNKTGNLNAIGEIWYEKAQASAHAPSLLLKLLFTSQTLSIQVHPDDSTAARLGLPNGKTEAWVILAAAPDSRVGLGLKRPVAAAEIRTAIADGSIEELIHWIPVDAGDVVFVPGGTIHSIGAGIVLAEIQQRSDATFRLFDYGRGRELHVDRGIGMSDLDAPPHDVEPAPQRLSAQRQLLLSCPYFTLERLTLPASARARLHVQPETWFLVLEGGGTLGETELACGNAAFIQAESTSLVARSTGMTVLTAYASPTPAHDLLTGPAASTPDRADLSALTSIGANASGLSCFTPGLRAHE